LTHYEQLGLSTRATAGEIKSAYRRLVMEHHPDRSKNPRSKEIFIKATEAYDVLSDPERRRVYDESVEQVARYKAERARSENVRKAAVTFAAPSPARATSDVQRLASLFAQNRRAEAERLAQEIRRIDPRQPLPYAILGDLARARGEVNEAAKMYAYAAQFDPQNATYQRRYEQLLGTTHAGTNRNDSTSLFSPSPIPGALYVGAGIVAACAAFIAVARPTPDFHRIGLISSWSLPLLLMLLLAGVCAGACLSAGHYVDRFASVSTTAVGSISPTLILSLVAIVNFWLSIVIYFLGGITQRAFNYSTTRLYAAVAVCLITMTLGSIIAGGAGGQTLLWGGNVIFLGGIVGWLLADALRPMR
jgi:curved DNA-binding protein CbpA